MFLIEKLYRMITGLQLFCNVQRHLVLRSAGYAMIE